jgi:hypothetical protein
MVSAPLFYDKTAAPSYGSNQSSTAVSRNRWRLSLQSSVEAYRQ